MASAIERAVDEAVDNESVECTADERARFEHHKRAYNNACIYADMFGVDVDEFRKHLCSTRAIDPNSL